MKQWVYRAVGHRIAGTGATADAAPAARPTLARRVVSGSVWTVAGFSFAQALRLVSNLIMTRLVAPEAFGLMAIATAAYVGLAMITDVGVNASVIRSKNGDDSDFLATAFTLQIARDLLIAVTLGLAGAGLALAQVQDAVAATSVYADPRAVGFIWLMGLSIGLSAFRAIKAAAAQRAMAVPALITLEIAGQAIALVAMIAAAGLGAGVYALGVGMLVANAVSVAGSYLFLQGPPSRIGWTREHASEILGFGKWILISSGFGFLMSRGDQVIFGYLMPKDAFSFYAIAMIWISAADLLVSTLLQRIAYPALSELNRRDPAGMVRAYRTFRNAADAGCVALFLGAAIIAPHLFTFLYPPEYADVAAYVAALSPMILLLPYRVLNQVVLAGGDSRRFAFLTLAPGTALIVGVPIIFDAFGPDAAVAFVSLAPIFGAPIAFAAARKFVPLSPWRELAPAAFALAAAGAMLAR